MRDSLCADCACPETAHKLEGYQCVNRPRCGCLGYTTPVEDPVELIHRALRHLTIAFGAMLALLIMTIVKPPRRDPSGVYLSPTEKESSTPCHPTVVDGVTVIRPCSAASRSGGTDYRYHLVDGRDQPLGVIVRVHVDAKEAAYVEVTNVRQ